MLRFSVLKKSWSIRAFSAALVASVVSLFLTGCETLSSTTSAGAVGVDRKQFILVPASQVEQASVEAYNEILGKAQKEGRLNTDSKLVRRVRRIADRIIPQTAAFRSDAPSWAWEVNVIEGEQVNAWCMAGGKIAFYTGLIEKLKLSDDEIAAVMGHEMAHALREHSRERVSQQWATSLGLQVLSSTLGLSASNSELAGMVTRVTFTLPYGRKHETEADRIGVELAARAGYDPRAAIGLWLKMSRQAGSRPPELLSTHPSPKNRIRDLRAVSKQVLPLYQTTRN